MSKKFELRSNHSTFKYQLDSVLKKTIILMSALLLTGCGKNNQSSENKVSDSASNTSLTSQAVSETDGVQNEKTTASANQTGDADDAGSKDESGILKSGSYEDAVRSYYDNMNNGEYKKILLCMYPEKMIESMFASGRITEENMADQIGLSDRKYEVTKIVEESIISDEEKEQLMSSFDQMITMLDIQSEYGNDINSLSEDQQKEINQKFNDIDFENMKHHYNITEGYDITVQYTSDGKDGEESLYIFYVEGEGWKMQQSMRKFVDNSRQARTNIYAKDLFYNYTSVLFELQTNGRSVNDTCIICSDDSKNINIPATVSAEELKESVDTSVPEDLQYFVVLGNNTCQYVAVFEDNEDKKYFASFPSESIPESMSDGNLETSSTEKKDYSFDELYNIAVDIIK